MTIFKEIDLNMAVITSIYVISKYSCITEVIHNSDGIWEFYGDDALKEDDFKVISLEEVLQIDDSIYQILFSIHSGYYAKRINKNSEWNIHKI